MQPARPHRPRRCKVPGARGHPLLSLPPWLGAQRGRWVGGCTPFLEGRTQTESTLRLSGGWRTLQLFPELSDTHIGSAQSVRGGPFIYYWHAFSLISSRFLVWAPCLLSPMLTQTIMRCRGWNPGWLHAEQEASPPKPHCLLIFIHLFFLIVF